MVERALPLDQHDVGAPAPPRAPAPRRRPATKSDGTASTATPRSAIEDAGLSGGDERGAHAARARAPRCGLERRRHLAHVAVAADGEHHQRVDAGGARAPRSARRAGGRRTSMSARPASRAPAPPARDRRRGTRAARRARPSRARARRAPSRATPAGSSPPCGAMPISRAVGTARRGRRRGRPPPGSSPPTPTQASARAAGAGRVDHRDHLVGAVAQHADRGLGVERREAPFGEQRQATSSFRACISRSESYTRM